MQNSKSKAQWEWKSNPNPFSDSEEPQWTPYPQSDNDKLEEAYQTQQKEISLGDYIISISDMLQKRKDNLFKQRAIRRNLVPTEEDEEREFNKEDHLREKRFFGAETPKTFNKAFGNLQDYLKFFQNRGPEIADFAKLFDEIEAKDDITQFNAKILPFLHDCIKTEASKTPNIKAEKKLLPLFQEEIAKMEEFYARVLKAYTIESFLYRKMNLYLRNEDWSQLDPLLPYAYCLCKAFFRAELAPKEQLEEGENMILYRGASFDEMTMSLYDTKTVKDFCWNAVTSTSRRRNIAQKFMLMNKDPNRPISVLFIIEVPMVNFEKEQTSKWIDIKPYSALPKEDEVILPPGSVFELSGVTIDNSTNIVEAHLKLIFNVEELAHQGQIMHGALYSEMANKTTFKFACLEERELSEAITHLKGNQVIEELEFCLCKFDEKVGVCLAQTLENMPRVKSLIFLSPSTKDKGIHWSLLLKHLEKIPIANLKITESSIDSHHFCSLAHMLCRLTSLSSLALNFIGCTEITNEGLDHLGGLKLLTALTSLTLDFSQCNQITDEGFKSLCLQDLTSLKSLNLNFRSCTKITDDGLKTLRPQRLTSLTLNFMGCPEITNEGLLTLGSPGFRNLTALELHFGCSKITDEGLLILASQGLKHFTLLTSLILNLSYCVNLTGIGLNHLSSQGLRYLTSLTILELHFQQCRKITDEGLKNFQELKLLPLLTSLTVDFADCTEIADAGLLNLCSQTFRDFTSLTSLALVFHHCNKITDEGLNAVTEQALKYLTSLIELTLHFGFCTEITDIGLINLSSQGLKCLPLLKSLSLYFGFCYNITNEGLNALCQEGLQHLTSLTSLAIFLRYCIAITDEGLNILVQQGLKSLPSLTSLTLNFNNCKEITNEGLNILVQQGLKSLTSLESLSLNYTGCSKITSDMNQSVQEFLNLFNQVPIEEFRKIALTTFARKLKDKSFESKENLMEKRALTFDNTKTLNQLITEKGISDCQSIVIDGRRYPTVGEISLLITEILDCVVSFTSLTLHFNPKFTDGDLSILSSQVLKHLSFLKNLVIYFFACEKITNEGLRDFCQQGLKNLNSLESFSLDFSHCTKITDKGLEILGGQGLAHFISLTALTLQFKSCKEITNEGLELLSSQGLKNLT